MRVAIQNSPWARRRVAGRAPKRWIGRHADRIAGRSMWMKCVCCDRLSGALARRFRRRTRSHLGSGSAKVGNKPHCSVNLVDARCGGCRIGRMSSVPACVLRDAPQPMRNDVALRKPRFNRRNIAARAAGKCRIPH
jgi:hypothetical protein